MTRWQKIVLIINGLPCALALLAYAAGEYLAVIVISACSIVASIALFILYAIRKWGPKHRRGKGE